MRTGKPWSMGSGRPFIASASIASRSSVRARERRAAVPAVLRGLEHGVCVGVHARLRQQVGHPDAAPPGVADEVAPDAVRHAVEGDPGLGALPVEQVLVGHHDLAVDHAVDPQAPVAGLDRGSHDRGVDQVEVVVPRLPGSDAGNPDPRGRGDLRLGDRRSASAVAGSPRAAVARGRPGGRRPREDRQPDRTPARIRNARRDEAAGLVGPGRRPLCARRRVPGRSRLGAAR